MASKSYDSNVFIQINIMIWAISGNIQMQPFSMKENGLLLGILLCLFGGLMSYISAKILLVRGSRYQTVEYIEVIEKSLGKKVSKITQVIISMGYCVS